MSQKNQVGNLPVVENAMQTRIGRMIAPLIVAVHSSLLLLSAPLLAATPLIDVRSSPDITVDLSGTIPDDEDVLADDLTGTVTLLNIGSLPGQADLDGYHRLPSGDQLFSLDTTAQLPGGLTAAPGDVVRFDGTTYTLEIDGTAEGLPSNALVDAVGMIEGGDLLLSFDITVSVDGITVDDEDLVRFDGVTFSLFLDGSGAGVTAALDLDAVHHLDPNGHLLLSFDGSGTLGGVDFDDEDVLEYDPVGATWEMAYDGSVQHSGWPQGDLDAVHAVAAVAGAVPDGDEAPGTPLTVSKAAGNDIMLDWAASCVASDTDYAVYEGLLGDFTSHIPVDNPNPFCTTLNDTEATITPATGSRYYLVVPQGDVREGSYGKTSGGPRPPSASACQGQLVGICD